MRLLIVNETPQCGGTRQSANFGKLTWQTVGHQQVDNMEVCCTFRLIAGGVCGADSRATKNTVGNMFQRYLQAHVSACFHLLVQRTKLTLYYVDLEYLQGQTRLMS